MNVLDVLRERGFVQQVSDEAGLRAVLERPITLYCGYDPTSSSLQVGNLVSIMMLAHLQRAGHRPIALVGSGTGLIGDPTGKTELRQMLTLDEIRRNRSGLRQQLRRYLCYGDLRVLDNSAWLRRLRYVDFLRDIGRHFSVNQLLQHETYRERLGGDGLNFIELNYALLQAYDFLHLYRQYACLLQVGGSDQWFNILAGVELIRREEDHKVFALVSPLITTASGAKMGKTEAGAIWLGSGRTSPHAFYQYWINTEDRDVERFLKLFTFLPPDEIGKLGALAGADLRQAKQVLAFEVTRLIHGEKAARQARATAQALFHPGGPSGSMASPEAFENVPTATLERKCFGAGLDLVEALVRVGLAPSRGAAKSQIQGGGIYVNGQRVARSDRCLSAADLVDGQILLRRGKKEYRRIVVAR